MIYYISHLGFSHWYTYWMIHWISHMCICDWDGWWYMYPDGINIINHPSTWRRAALLSLGAYICLRIVPGLGFRVNWACSCLQVCSKANVFASVLRRRFRTWRERWRARERSSALPSSLIFSVFNSSCVSLDCSCPTESDSCSDEDSVSMYLLISIWPYYWIIA